MGMADALPLKLLLFVCLLGHIQGESASLLTDNPPIGKRDGSGMAASPLANGADQRGLLVVGKTAPFCGITRSHPAIIAQKLARLGAAARITPVSPGWRRRGVAVFVAMSHRCRCCRANSGDSHC